MRDAILASLLTFTCSAAAAQASTNYLASNTVLIIRHAEKPAAGPLLTEKGSARAKAYVRYFEPFHENSLQFDVDALYAGGDSEGSSRPRLTLEPLSKATGLPLHLDASTKEPEKLLAQLRDQPHGTHPLIAWRHGQIPQLLLTLGADPAGLLPGAKWPDDVYDWIIVLRFDANGKLIKQDRLAETLTVAP